MSIALLATASIVLLCSPALSPFVLSDGELLTRQATYSAAPYYNLLYLPLAHLAVRAGEAWAGAGPESALIAFARGCALLGGLGLYATLRRVSIGRESAAAAAALAVLAPGLALYTSIVEVHALAFAGASWALYLAQRSFECRGLPALAFALLSVSLALASHLSHVLLVPCLFAIASRGRFWRSSALAAGLALVVGASAYALIAVQGLGPRQVQGNAVLAPLHGICKFAGVFVHDLSERGLFGPSETARFLWQEWLLPAGCLLAAVAVALPAVRRSATPAARALLLRLALGAAFTAAVFSQGGVWERGGYSLSYLALGTLGCGLVLNALPRRARVALALALLGGQVAWARAHTHALHRTVPDARPWADAIVAELRPGDDLLVGALERAMAVRLRRKDIRVSDLSLVFERRPRRLWTEQVPGIVLARFGNAAPEGRLLVEAHLWGARGAEPWGRLLYEELQRAGVAPRPVGEGELLLELVRAGESAEPRCTRCRGGAD